MLPAQWSTRRWQRPRCGTRLRLMSAFIQQRLCHCLLHRSVSTLPDSLSVPSGHRTHQGEGTVQPCASSHRSSRDGRTGGPIRWHTRRRRAWHTRPRGGPRRCRGTRRVGGAGGLSAAAISKRCAPIWQTRCGERQDRAGQRHVLAELIGSTGISCTAVLSRPQCFASDAARMAIRCSPCERYALRLTIAGRVREAGGKFPSRMIHSMMRP